LSYYLDTRAIYSYIFEDAHSPAAEKWIGDANRPLIISDWVESEFGALINRRVRDGGLAVDAAVSGLSEFDSFALGHAQRYRLSGAAGARAAVLARDPALKLSAADALHLALSAEGGHCLVTFDIRLAEAARVRGFDVEVP
jgi:predicted nucleic acid-binding protein